MILDSIFMQTNIRKATIKDAKAISAIWKIICEERIYTAVNHPFTQEQVRSYIQSLSDREETFIAIVNDLIVGFQSLDMWAKYTDSFDHVGAIGTFILPKWRGKKISYQLADYTIEFARKNGYEKFIIYVRSGNKNAQAFYKNLGFVPKGVLTRQVKIDGKYEDEIFMELFL
ncbi:MAG: GNAT family N-acetyltransferase [Promethearchaeota archaeon]